MKVKDFFKDYNEVKAPCDVDESFLSGVIHAAEAATRSSGDGIYVLDYIRRKVVYVSSNIARWCNMPINKDSKGGYDGYLEHINEEDSRMLDEINRVSFDFWKDMSDEECMSYSVSYDFQLGNAMLHQRYTPILVKDGYVVMAMCILSPSQSKKSGNVVMSSPENQYEYIYSLTKREWSKVAKICLSSREKEIIRSSVKGLSSTEIAEKNGTSDATVKTQRRFLFKKLGVKTMSEAIRMALNKGML